MFTQIAIIENCEVRAIPPRPLKGTGLLAQFVDAIGPTGYNICSRFQERS